MNFETAILNLNNADQCIKAQALELCRQFQTPYFFDWSIWSRLADYSSPPNIRLFAYSTLSIIFKESWAQLAVEVQSILLNNFPYFIPSLFNNDPIKDTIIHTDAIFLLYAAPPGFLRQLFSHFDENNVHFFAALITELVVCACNQEQSDFMKQERKIVIEQFFSTFLPSIIHNLIFHPLSCSQIDSDCFCYFISLLGQIHMNMPQISESLLNSPEIEQFYASFAHLVWMATSNLSIAWILDSILSNSNCQPLTILHNLVVTAPTSFIQNYPELFFQKNPTENYPKFLDSFIARIPIFFGLLDHLDLETLCPFFSMLNVMLQSSAPSIIYEVSENAILLIKRLNLQAPDFHAVCFGQRMSLFDTIIKIISIPLNTLPGAIYDQTWDKSAIRNSVFTLAITISEIDNENVVKELMRMILAQNSETPLFQSLVRLLSSSLNTSIEINIINESKEVTAFLLASALNISRKFTNYVFPLLTKLLYYIDYSDEELNVFFLDFLELYIKYNPLTHEPFSVYFNSFVRKFIRRLQIPLDRLQTVTQEDPCFYVISSLISQITGTELCSDSAIIDIDWFISEFCPYDQLSFNRLNCNVSRSFGFFAQNPPKDQNYLFAVLSKFIDANNVLVSVVNGAQDELQVNKLISPLGHLSDAIITFFKVNPNSIFMLIEKLSPPLLLSEFTSVWLKKIGLPILTIISPISIEAASNFAHFICSKLINIVETVENNPETPSSVENVAKKVCVFLVQLCKLLNEEDAVHVMKVALKLDDFRVYSNVVDTSASKGIHIFALFWNDLIAKREIQYTDKLIEALLFIYEKENRNIEVFLQLPNVNIDQLIALNSKLVNCENARKKRRYFRELLP